MEKSVERLVKIADPSLVSFKNSIVKDLKINDLIAVVRDAFTNLPQNVSYKQNTEFILYCCKLVENFITKKDGVNKKEIVIQILKTILGLTEPEVKVVDGIIEFLHSNKMRSKIKLSKKFINGVGSWFKKKVL